MNLQLKHNESEALPKAPSEFDWRLFDYNFQLSVGDYVYFIEGNYEYESKVVEVDSNRAVTIEHADENGNIQARMLGGWPYNKLNVTSIKPVALFANKAK